VVKGLPPLINAVALWALAPERSTSPGMEAALLQRLRDVASDLKRVGVAWHQNMVSALSQALRQCRLHAGRGAALGRQRPQGHRVDQRRQALHHLLGVHPPGLVGQAGRFAEGRHGVPCRWEKLL
jgi:hypothetical protein